MSSYRGGSSYGGGGGGGGGGGYRGRDDERRSSYDDYSSRDRSRSRDTYDRGSSYGSAGSGRYGSSDGGGRGGGGRGGGGGGGRGGGYGGGGRGGMTGPRPTSITVRTNYFPLTIPRDLKLFQYQVEIKKAMILRGRNESDGTTDPPPLGHDDTSAGTNQPSNRVVTGANGQAFVPRSDRGGVEKPALKMDESTVISRRVLFQALKDMESVSSFIPPIATDGGALLLALRPIPEEFLIMPIKVKEDCDESDKFADCARVDRFIVSLTPTGVIDFSQMVSHTAGMDKYRQCLDVIIKNSLERIGLKTFGKSPRTFYFDDRIQPDILGNTLSRMYTNKASNFMPWVGISQSARFGENGAYIAVDSKIDFIDRDGIPFVNDRESKILGVRVSDLYRPIRDENIRKEITNAIEKITFHVQYKKTFTEEKRQFLRSKGLSEDAIEKKSIVVRRNKKISKDTSKGVGILWAADDPMEYSFEQRPRRGEPEGAPSITYTCASYYEKVYGIRLRYPKMPIVFIGKKEWFPVEFLTQALAKSYGANTADQVRGVLGYHDEFAGTSCVTNIENLSRRALIDDQLRRFNLTRSKEPVTLAAKVLPEPKLLFARNENAMINNGSWDLRNKKFYQPSELRSFAVIDFAGNKSMAYVKNLLKVCADHGIMTPGVFDIRDERMLSNLIVNGDDSRPDLIISAFEKAIERAKSVFLRDAERLFGNNKVFFKTRVARPDENKLYDALIIPPPSREYYGDVGLILRAEDNTPTHSRGPVEFRIQIKVQGRHELIDPFDFEYDSSDRCHKVHGQRVSFEKFVYKDQTGAIHEEDGSFMPIIIYNEKYIEDPIIFVYLRDNSTTVYNTVKMASWHILGVPSACAVHSKFESQKNRDQYCSNIALKLNAKLSTCHNRGRAWLTSHDNVENIPWVREVPTLVLGISVSHGFGSSGAKSIISATVSLDPGCMQFAQNVRVQSKTELINELVLRDLIMPLMIEFQKRAGTLPTRILVYRDGVSEGSLERVKVREVRAIRRAYIEFLETLEPGSYSGDVFACPPITFLACLVQHNIKICPATMSDAIKNNVPSGTCVDHTIVHFMNMSVSESDANSSADPSRVFPGVDINSSTSFDFILTAQGGLKGTSKPIYFRTLINENAVYKPLGSYEGTPLTKEILEILTYHMSFQYGTATKAVRAVPVLYYSSRLANVVMGYMKNLLDHGDVESKSLEEEESNRPRNRFGELLDFEMFVRKDMSSHQGAPSYARSDLMPKFTLGVRDLDDPQPNQPFFCHLAA